MMIARGIVERLVLEGFGIYETNLFIGMRATFPQGAGPFFSVIDTGGVFPLGTHNKTNDGKSGKTAIRRPRFQILGRGSDPGEVRRQLELAYDALTFDDVVITLPAPDAALKFISVTPYTEVADLPPDTERRARLAFNIDCKVTLA